MMQDTDTVFGVWLKPETINSQQLIIVYAFADTEHRGNPAGVALVTEKPNPEYFQRLASENELPIVVTVQALGHDEFELRWFTRNSELSICGHGTLAASYVLFDKGIVSGDRIKFNSLSGHLWSRLNQGEIELDLPRLGANLEDSSQGDAVQDVVGIPLESVKFVQEDIVAVARSSTDVEHFQPDFSKISSLNCRGIMLTARADSVHDNDGYDIVSRFFGPRIGIDEDQVCGSAHCRIYDYWSDRLNKNELWALQASRNGGRLVLAASGERLHIRSGCRYSLLPKDRPDSSRRIQLLPLGEKEPSGIRTWMRVLAQAPGVDNRSPFSFARFRVGNEGVTEPHEHSVAEIWYVISGQGVLSIQGASRTLIAEDIVYIPPNMSHRLRNTGNEPIDAISLWWEPANDDTI